MVIVWRPVRSPSSVCQAASATRSDPAELRQLRRLWGAEGDHRGRGGQQAGAFVLVAERDRGLRGQHHAGSGTPAALQQVDRLAAAALDGGELVDDDQGGGAWGLAVGRHGEVPHVAQEDPEAGVGVQAGDHAWHGDHGQVAVLP